MTQQAPNDKVNPWIRCDVNVVVDNTREQHPPPPLCTPQTSVLLLLQAAFSVDICKHAGPRGNSEARGRNERTLGFKTGWTPGPLPSHESAGECRCLPNRWFLFGWIDRHLRMPVLVSPVRDSIPTALLGSRTDRYDGGGSGHHEMERNAMKRIEQYR